jgi:hypothetical protein
MGFLIYQPRVIPKKFILKSKHNIFEGIPASKNDDHLNETIGNE